MRHSLMIALTLCVVSLCGATEWDLSNVAPDKDTYIGDGAFDGREGGESFSDALVITTCNPPYVDTGATCDNIDDITLGCAASNAPDVVYVYTSPSSGFITVSLCGSGYDTALGIYNAGFAELYCNDDYCGLQSEIAFPAEPGETYYFVVDGFSTSCGSYTLTVSCMVPGCDTGCPPDGVAEGETDCYNGYYDQTNGGCNSEGWTLLCPDFGHNSVVMCGTSGTYLYEGLNYRDTDWIKVYGDGGPMSVHCCATFPLQLIFIYGTDCNNLQYYLFTANPYQPITYSQIVGAGVEVWIWIGPSVFEGVLCGSEYLLTMDRIWCEPIASEHSTLGRIKSLFR